MPVIAEEAKRATKMEVGDLALEVVSKAIRVYELASATKLKSLAYSDTFMGARLLHFIETNKAVPAKDFTVARLYKKPENARKIIARYFPKYAAAGATAHLYYSGRGPRGLSVAGGEGYFSVPLAGPAERREGPFNTLWNRQQAMIEEADITLRPGQPEETALTVERGKVTRIKARGKTVPVSDEALHRIRSIHGAAARRLSVAEFKVWNSIKWPLNLGDMKPGQPFEYKGEHYVKLFKGARKSEVLSVATGQVINIGLSDYDLVKPVKSVTLGENYWRLIAAGFKHLQEAEGESMPTSTDPTFEQVARIIRRARGAGFTTGRIMLTERLNGQGPRLARPPMRGSFRARSSMPPISTDDYIFVIHHEDEDTYSVAHSVHDDPRLGYQELQTGLSQRAANRFERQMKARWKVARVRRFLVTGQGHKREFLPESDLEEQAPSRFEIQKEYDKLLLKYGHDKAKRQVEKTLGISRLRVNPKGGILSWTSESNEEKRKRVIAAVDLEVKDPANKGLTLMQVLRAMFKGVDEARKWAPVWTAAVRRPWRLADQEGKYLRKPAEGRVHRAYAFDSAEKAFAFLKSSKGRKAVATQESLDEATTITPNEMKMASLALLKKIKSMRWEEMSGKEALAFAKKFIKGKLPKLSDKQAAQVALVTLNVFVGEDTDEARAKVIVRKLKDEVNYRRSEEERPDERCGNCAFIGMPDECKRVRGKIDQDFTCDLWKRGVSEARVRFMCMNCRRAFRTQNGVLARGGQIECPYCGATNVTLMEDLDEALSKKARSVFNALETNPEGLPVDKIKHYGMAGDVANLPMFLKKFVKKGWVEQKGDLYLPTAAYWRSQGHAPWIPFAKAKALKNAVFSTMSRGLPDRRLEIILYDKKGKQVARTHVTATEMKQLPALPISWTDLMWIERHGEPSPGVQMRMKEDLDEAEDYNRPIDPEKWGVSMFKVAPPGRSELHVMLPPGADKKLIDKIINSVSGQLITKTRKKMTWLTKGRRFKQEMVAKIIRGWKEKTGWASESLDEAAAQGAVQKNLLNFVKQLPPRSESTLADVAKRQEFRRVHFKRLMSAAKALAKKGLIWYDGYANVGPLKV